MPHETYGVHKSLRERISKLFGTKYRHGHAEPAEIIKHMVEMADNTAQRWPQGTLYHNLFIVSVGQEAWDDCYAGAEKQCEAWLAEALQQHIQEVGGLSGKVVVRLVLDPRLTENVASIQNHFDKNALDEDETQRLNMITGNKGESTNVDDTLYVLDAKGKMTAKEAVEAVEWDDTDDGEVENTERPHAFILFNGASYTIYAGETIGRRVTGRSLADVKLDDLGEHSPTSKLHCRIDCDEEGWIVTNLGRNGTLVINTDCGYTEEVVLTDNESTRIYDKGVLVLGPDGARVLFTVGR